MPRSFERNVALRIRAVSRFRLVVRKLVPLRGRVAVRRFLRELPIRMRDLRADLSDRKSSLPLPPATRRAAVGLTSSREEFIVVGASLAEDLIATLGMSGIDVPSLKRWLDFGCGSGRVARHFSDPEISLTGIDVDARAVRWCARYLPGTFLVTDPLPPTPFADASFDLIYSVSVFTHLDAEPQFAWLAELRRLLRPGGVLIASTHSPELLYNRPDALPDDRLQLERTGFLFLRGFGPFNDDSAFHSREYLEEKWSDYFELKHHRPFGLDGYQDLSVWVKLES
jgi:SAM-dependent methyltransferase